MPVGLVIDDGNRHNIKLVRATLEGLVIARPQYTADSPQVMCSNKHCHYAEVRALLFEFGFTARIRSRDEAVQDLALDANKRDGAELSNTP